MRMPTPKYNTGDYVIFNANDMKLVGEINGASATVVGARSQVTYSVEHGKYAVNEADIVCRVERTKKLTAVLRGSRPQSPSSGTEPTSASTETSTPTPNTSAEPEGA